MKFTNSAAILIAMIIAVMVAASDCGILRDMLLNRRSRDAADNDEEHNVGSGGKLSFLKKIRTLIPFNSK